MKRPTQHHHAAGPWWSCGRLRSPKPADSTAVSIRTKTTMKFSSITSILSWWKHLYNLQSYRNSAPATCCLKHRNTQSLNFVSLAWHREKVKEKDLRVDFACPSPSILNACPPLFQQICKAPPNLSSHQHRHREHTSMINGVLYLRSWLHCSTQWEIWLSLIQYWHKCQCCEASNIVLNQGSLSSFFFFLCFFHFNKLLFCVLPKCSRLKLSGDNLVFM